MIRVFIFKNMKKEELIKGKWYKFLSSDKIWYMKFNVITNTNIVSSLECISLLTGFGGEANFGELGSYNFIPINISEIANLLPKNHPDLQNKIYELW